MRKLDKSKPYGEVHGLSLHKFEQNGLRYDAHGNCLDQIPEPAEEEIEDIEEVEEEEVENENWFED